MLKFWSISISCVRTMQSVECPTSKNTCALNHHGLMVSSPYFFTISIVGNFTKYLAPTSSISNRALSSEAICFIKMLYSLMLKQRVRSIGLMGRQQVETRIYLSSYFMANGGNGQIFQCGILQNAPCFVFVSKIRCPASSFDLRQAMLNGLGGMSMASMDDKFNPWALNPLILSGLFVMSTNSRSKMLRILQISLMFLQSLQSLFIPICQYAWNVDISPSVPSRYCTNILSLDFATYPQPLPSCIRQNKIPFPFSLIFCRAPSSCSTQSQSMLLRHSEVMHDECILIQSGEALRSPKTRDTIYPLWMVSWKVLAMNLPQTVSRATSPMQMVVPQRGTSLVPCSWMYLLFIEQYYKLMFWLLQDNLSHN